MSSVRRWHHQCFVESMTSKTHLDLDLDCLHLFLFGLAMSLGIELTMVYQYYDFIILQFESLTYMKRSLEVILWKAPPLTLECLKEQIV